ncbi:MAG: tetratricopeptide repeat protein [Ignavibacteria bacterium]
MEKFIKLEAANPMSLSVESSTILMKNIEQGFCSYYSRGLWHYCLKEYSKAIAVFNNVILDCKEDIIAGMTVEPIKVYFYRGLSYYYSHDFESAISDYNKTIEINPKYALLYYYRGLAYFYSNDLSKALSDVTTALESEHIYYEDYVLKIYFNATDAYIYRGFIHYNLKDYSSSISDYSKAIQLNPKYELAYFLRGKVNFILDDFPSAKSDFTNAIDANPEYIEAYINRGNTYIKLQHYSYALIDFEKAIELNNNSAEAYFSRGFFYHYCIVEFSEYSIEPDIIIDGIKIEENEPPNSDDYDEDGEYVDIFKPSFDEDGDLIDNPVDNFYDPYYIDCKKAISDYNKAILLNPKYAEAYYYRGLIYSTMYLYHEDNEYYDINRAIADFKIALDINKEYEEAYYALGEAYMVSEKFLEAIYNFTKVIELNSNNIESFNKRGNSFLSMNDYCKSLLDFNKVIEMFHNGKGEHIKHDKYEIFRNRGLANYYSGNKSQACEDWHIAASLGDSSARKLIKQFCENN